MVNNASLNLDAAYIYLLKNGLVVQLDWHCCITVVAVIFSYLVHIFLFIFTVHYISSFFMENQHPPRVYVYSLQNLSLSKTAVARPVCVIHVMTDLILRRCWNSFRTKYYYISQNTAKYICYSIGRYFFKGSGEVPSG